MLRAEVSMCCLLPSHRHVGRWRMSRSEEWQATVRIGAQLQRDGRELWKLGPGGLDPRMREGS